MYLTLVVCVLSVEAVINPYGPTIVNDYVNCISDVINHSFNTPGLLVFANDNDRITLVSNVRNKLLKRIHHTLKFVVKIEALNTNSEYKEFNVSLLHNMEHHKISPAALYYVVIVDSYEEFLYFLDIIVRSSHWNPYAKFVIFFYSYYATLQRRLNIVENILTSLFENNAIDVIVILPDIKNLRIANVYVWEPYDPPNHCGYFNETANDRLQINNICDHGILKHKNNIFENKLPYNMRKCSLHILALERNPFMSENPYDPNIEKELVKALLSKFNFSSKYTFVHLFRGVRDDTTGEWNGALGEIVSKKSHILLGGIFPDFNIHKDFECSSSYLADSYTWVVPRANPAPPWVALTIIFNDTVWYSAITGFFLGVFTWSFLGRVCKDSSYNKTLDHCLMNALIVYLGFSAYTRPTKESLRVFFVFFNIYSLILLTAYQTKLIVVLQNPKFDQQIGTVEDIVLSGLKFGGFQELRGLFLNSSDPFDSSIGERWIVVDNMTKALIDVTVHKNFSVLCSRLELAHLSSVIPELNDAFEKFTYFALSSNIFTVSMEMVAMKGFPFMKRFSHTLNLYKQLGINEGVRRKFRFDNQKNRSKLLIATYEQRDRFYPLSLDHLQCGFFALGLGIIIGSTILIVEIIVYHV